MADTHSETVLCLVLSVLEFVMIQQQTTAVKSANIRLNTNPRQRRSQKLSK